MKPNIPLIAAALGAAAPAIADPRIATHLYQPSEVVAIHGRSDTQSTITFAPDERIENIAVGDSASWQVMPNKRADLLFLKPLKAGARTNMTVITDQRTYLFDLLGASARAPAVYMLRFTYPAKPKPVPVASIPAVVATAATTSPAPDPATLNFAWTGHGEKALLPLRSFDDGRSTYLAWPKDVPLPAILVREAKGVEGPVNYTTRGDYIVVEGVPSQLVLRAGKQMATLTPAPRPAPRSDPPAGERTAMIQKAPTRLDAHALDGQQ
ncbi:MAG: virB9 [Sphingomonas bacterium]|jgi:type IV secretion system protein VirB9|nr:virB9 [Sphingomonas bacterium]